MNGLVSFVLMGCFYLVHSKVEPSSLKLDVQAVYNNLSESAKKRVDFWLHKTPENDAPSIRLSASGFVLMVDDAFHHEKVEIDHIRARRALSDLQPEYLQNGKTFAAIL